MKDDIAQQAADVVSAKVVSGMSYVGAGTSVASALTMTDIGIIVGIVTAVLTFSLNAWFQWDRRRREIKEHALRVQSLQEDLKQ
jgi:ABC-type amino acid transport system permease subunit